MNGVLIIDKPAGLTSHDVVNRVRRILQERSVGHLGTLDPLATGVLPLLVGNLTRLAQFYTSCEKVYEGVIRFGFATDTYDSEGEPTSEPRQISLTVGDIEALAEHFRGEIQQLPPPFSAKKIKGVPAYKLARKKKDVALQPVKVEVKEFTVVAVEGHEATVRARVTSGTYIRSVAHDMGQALGCGAHLKSLRRTAVGEFGISNAQTLDELETATRHGDPEDLFVHPRKILPEFPAVTATDEMASRIRAGRTVNLLDLSPAPRVKVFYGPRELIAIASRVAGTLFHPKIVLAVETPTAAER
ncbi:MAG TPA: tRNA pseudouridine(55) synthase TruB [Terriglobales bacterium]